MSRPVGMSTPSSLLSRHTIRQCCSRAVNCSPTEANVRAIPRTGVLSSRTALFGGNRTQRQLYYSGVLCRSFLDSLFGKGGSTEAEDSSTHEPVFARIDPESDGGLGGTSEEVFGPLAVLLVGFSQREAEAFRSLMIEMEADMVKIICCSRALFDGTVRDALEAPVPAYEQMPADTRRAVLLSGMYGGEVSEVIGAYADSGLPPAVWAAAVPANYERTVKALVDDIYGDNRYMMEKKREMEARRAALNQG